jgi:hypothetical protein
MSAATNEQTFANHARYVPGFHFITGTLNIIILVWAIYRFATLRTATEGFGVMVAIVLLAHFWYLRQFPLAVQNRLIRLEERLRLERLLPKEAGALAEALTADQLIALRFASDAELPALAKRVVEQRITTRSQIKALVTNWRPDHLRA